MCITFFCLYPYSIDKNTTSQSKQKYEKVVNNYKHKHIKKFNKTKQLKKENKIKEQQIKNQIITQQKGCQQSKIKFIIAFNRDEQSERRTLKMGPYQQDPNIFAGRDLKSTGTWLGVNVKTAIMVILTNYDLPVFRPGKSRGQLVKSFLNTKFVPEQILSKPQLIDQKIQSQLTQVLKYCHKKQYPAFNLLVYNIRTDKINYICSQLDIKTPISLDKNKMYGLCNTDLFNIWPKTKHGLQLFSNLLGQVINKQDEKILDSLVNEVMKDKKLFSANPNDEASIFIQPFYSTLQNAERMTKSTFVAIIKDKIQEGQQQQKPRKSQLIMREITHQNVNYMKTRSKNKKQNQKQTQQKTYDHFSETVVNYRFII